MTARQQAGFSNVVRGDEELGKYQNKYEESMNPFEAFRGRVSLLPPVLTVYLTHDFGLLGTRKSASQSQRTRKSVAFPLDSRTIKSNHSESLHPVFARTTFRRILADVCLDSRYRRSRKVSPGAAGFGWRGSRDLIKRDFCTVSYSFVCITRRTVSSSLSLRRGSPWTCPITKRRQELYRKKLAGFHVP